eukprot:470-Rhodomonas_salina.1
MAGTRWTHPTRSSPRCSPRPPPLPARPARPSLPPRRTCACPRPRCIARCLGPPPSSAAPAPCLRQPRPLPLPPRPALGQLLATSV